MTLPSWFSCYNTDHFAGAIDRVIYLNSHFLALFNYNSYKRHVFAFTLTQAEPVSSLKRNQ